MVKRLGLGCLIGLVATLVFVAAVAAHAQRGSPVVYRISVEGPLTPVWITYIERSIGVAERDGAQALLLVLNTPGGQINLMQRIVEIIRASQAPVIVYVSPRGASAASAGTLITLAGHASAMAPETTIGAASPVGSEGQDIDETLERKIKEDIRALARALTERRGEQATELAEATIEEARAVFATEALEAGLIDFVATDRADLLRQLDGFTVDVAGRPVTLKTAAAQVESLEMTLIEQILNRVVDPNILALLLFIGVQAILIELSNPGGWVAGFVGVISLGLAVYGLGILPINWLGLGLIILAFVLFVLDIKAPTHGALTIVGAITLIAGLLVLFSQPGVEEFGRLSIPLVIALGVGTALFFGFIVTQGLRAQRARPVTGVEGLIGSIGVARGDLTPEGFVFVQGERWKAIAEDGEIKEGTSVQVIGIDGFRLKVRRAQS